MKALRISQLAALSVAGTMALAACGSASNDDAAGGGGTSAAAATSSSACTPGNLTGAGSTAQQNAMAQATAGYKARCGSDVSYNGTGSGAGITSFITKQVDFAGSDSALNPQGKDGDEVAKAAAACGSPAWDLPMVTGPIAVAYHVKGVDTLVLTPSVTAQIFSGKITKWNDPAIAKLNPGVTLPAEAISVFFRSDSSGTTDNFTNYLNTAAPSDWTAKHAKDWSGKVGQGKAKSAGVSQAISSTEGGIGYVEWSFAITDKLKMAQIDNGSGPVALTAESAGKAVEAATIAGTGNDLALNIDYSTKAEGAYPIVLVTYEIVCSKNADPAKGKAVKSFMSYLVSDDFQNTLTSIGSAPLPTSIKDKVTAAVAALS
ncbi:Phosphate-binding protein pstS 2 [Nostocoides japonicum T1-X7]|uniref:Phosphate-binding protein n=1 Tax=Nostocoides japonicum T1-X7 TaxID=1194083 RepID=A0A077LUK3_9MICO|nr:phosphate ABC transporter substrate-binding protein PstS [Tetrasphaera japonica]CCH77206.1 Phosphate-binding protein pstS 2 [Tetrasphaera japonica T1-X7]